MYLLNINAHLIKLHLNVVICRLKVKDHLKKVFIVKFRLNQWHALSTPNYGHRNKFMNHIFLQTQEVNYYCDLAQKLLSLSRLLFLRST